MEMKPAYSPIFHDLSQAYQASESHDITRRDFTIERTQGSDGFPKYTTTPRDLSAFTPAEHDIPVGYLSKDGVFNLYQEACPPRIVGESNNDPFTTTALPGDKQATNGAIKNAPDF